MLPLALEPMYRFWDGEVNGNAGGTACATNGKSFVRNSGACFSLPSERGLFRLFRYFGDRLRNPEMQISERSGVSGFRSLSPKFTEIPKSPSTKSSEPRPLGRVASPPEGSFATETNYLPFHNSLRFQDHVVMVAGCPRFGDYLEELEWAQGRRRHAVALKPEVFHVQIVA